MQWSQHHEMFVTIQYYKFFTMGHSVHTYQPKQNGQDKTKQIHHKLRACLVPLLNFSQLKLFQLLTNGTKLFYFILVNVFGTLATKVTKVQLAKNLARGTKQDPNRLLNLQLCLCLVKISVVAIFSRRYTLRDHVLNQCVPYR